MSRFRRKREKQITDEGVRHGQARRESRMARIICDIATKSRNQANAEMKRPSEEGLLD